MNHYNTFTCQCCGWLLGLYKMYEDTELCIYCADSLSYEGEQEDDDSDLY